MTDDRLRPRGITPSTDEGAVLATVDGVVTWVVPTRPLTAVPLISINEVGAPGFIFDENGNVYYTEV